MRRIGLVEGSGQCYRKNPREERKTDRCKDLKMDD